MNRRVLHLDCRPKTPTSTASADRDRDENVAGGLDLERRSRDRVLPAAASAHYFQLEH